MVTKVLIGTQSIRKLVLTRDVFISGFFRVWKNVWIVDIILRSSRNFFRLAPFPLTCSHLFPPSSPPPPPQYKNLSVSPLPLSGGKRYDCRHNSSPGQQFFPPRPLPPLTCSRLFPPSSSPHQKVFAVSPLPLSGGKRYDC